MEGKAAARTLLVQSVVTEERPGAQASAAAPPRARSPWFGFELWPRRLALCAAAGDRPGYSPWSILGSSSPLSRSQAILHHRRARAVLNPACALICWAAGPDEPLWSHGRSLPSLPPGNQRQATAAGIARSILC